LGEADFFNVVEIDDDNAEPELSPITSQCTAHPSFHIDTATMPTSRG